MTKRIAAVIDVDNEYSNDVDVTSNLSMSMDVINVDQYNAIVHFVKQQQARIVSLEAQYNILLLHGKLCLEAGLMKLK